MITSQPTKVIGAVQFLEFLQRGRGELTARGLTVQGDVTIDGEKLGKIGTIRLGGIVFTDPVEIEHFSSGRSVLADDCHFLGGLRVANTNGVDLSVRDANESEVVLGYLDVRRSAFKNVFLRGLKIKSRAPRPRGRELPAARARHVPRTRAHW